MPGLNSQIRGTDRISSEFVFCVVLVIVLCYCLYAVLWLLCCCSVIICVILCIDRVFCTTATGC